ncbi:MAG: radical SAM protein [Acidobacteriia bacterium]|nr:radical SAM protein [Terriglobia bacterium]
MKCRFCFAQFKDVRNTILPKGHQPKEQAIEVVESLAAHGFDKITYVGGEPTLCPWLSELIGHGHQLGMTTMIVTNGSRITEEFLNRVNGSLDWLTLSIDSAKPDTLAGSGRSVGGKPMTPDRYIQLADQVRASGIRLKVNSVVHGLNWQENMVDFISRVGPERWKLFQAMPVKGQNDRTIDDLLITPEQFAHFVRINRRIEEFNVVLCPEPNDLMRGSYVMVDPAGRFFDSTTGTHTYSQPILRVGVTAALNEVSVLEDRFDQRGGYYDWRGKPNAPMTAEVQPLIASLQ